MRTYETIIIVHPEMVGDEYAAIVEKFKKVLVDQGSEILKFDEWGTRKLAYMVKKQGRGTYLYVAYKAPAAAIKEFERRMRIDESIIKFQTVHLEKGLTIAPVAAVAEGAPSEDEGEETEVEA